MIFIKLLFSVNSYDHKVPEKTVEVEYELNSTDERLLDILKTLLAKIREKTTIPVIYSTIYSYCRNIDLELSCLHVIFYFSFIFLNFRILDHIFILSHFFLP